MTYQRVCNKNNSLWYPLFQAQWDISSTFKKKSIYQWLFYFKQEVLKQYTEFTAFTRHIDGLDPFFLSLEIDSEGRL
jgi:hypothetical protein